MNLRRKLKKDPKNGIKKIDSLAALVGGILRCLSCFFSNRKGDEKSYEQDEAPNKIKSPVVLNLPDAVIPTSEVQIEILNKRNTTHTDIDDHVSVLVAMYDKDRRLEEAEYQPQPPSEEVYPLGFRAFVGHRWRHYSLEEWV